jgi:hypothetical protein
VTLGATVEQEVKGGKVVDEFTPKLGINGRGRYKKLEFDSSCGEQFLIEILFRRHLSKIAG